VGWGISWIELEEDFTSSVQSIDGKSRNLSFITLFILCCPHSLQLSFFSVALILATFCNLILTFRFSSRGWNVEIVFLLFFFTFIELISNAVEENIKMIYYDCNRPKCCKLWPNLNRLLVTKIFKSILHNIIIMFTGSACLNSPHVIMYVSLDIMNK